jgi:electron transport complex protein RnfC
MIKKKKLKKRSKKGLNLLTAYPIKFSEAVESVEYDGPLENFSFTFPKKKVEHIIVNLCQTEPWALPNWAVFNGDIASFLYKLEKVLTEYFPGSHCHIVIGYREKKLINEFKQYKDNAENQFLKPLSLPLLKGKLEKDSENEEYFHLHTADTIYPYDAPVLIIKNVLGLDIAFGEDTTKHGILLLDAQAISAVFEHYIQNNEFNTRLIPISGTGLNENKILRVKLGTPIKHILASYIKPDIKYRIFLDGPLNGTEVEDLTQKADWAVKNIVVMEERDYKTPFNYARVDELRFTTSLMGEVRRCVYCNYCDDICPVNLEPALYWHCHARGEKQKARLYALEKCIECGLCSFICPSKLELLQVIKECKS